MSINDPGGGALSGGGQIQVFDEAGGSTEPVIVVTLMPCQITYNGKTISLTRPPFQLHIDPVVPRTVNRTLTGVVETILQPRINVSVRAGFRPDKSTSSRVRVDNFIGWMLRGGAFSVVVDSSKNVSTTLSAQAAIGATVLAVANASGITVGDLCVVIGGPYYQLARVTDVSGSNVTIADALDATFPSGAVFRHWLRWDGLCMDPEARTPVQERLDVAPIDQNCFDWTLDFVEATP